MGALGLLIAAAGITGCGASKQFVRTEVSGVSNDVRSLEQRVNSLEAEADETRDLASDNRERTKSALSDVESLRDNETMDYQSVRTVTVHFDFDTAMLSDKSKETLDALADDLSSRSTTGHLQIQGFADSSGDPEYNQWLSDRRATAVSRYLAARLSPSGLFPVTMIGLGEENPVATNDTRTGREENRRVEVHFLVPERPEMQTSQRSPKLGSVRAPRTEPGTGQRRAGYRPTRRPALLDACGAGVTPVPLESPGDVAARRFASIDRRA
jgi:outer membrane protein OmpA-like peptidoglycan-associated protein